VPVELPLHLIPHEAVAGVRLVIIAVAGAELLDDLDVVFRPELPALAMYAFAHHWNPVFRYGVHAMYPRLIIDNKQSLQIKISIVNDYS
jgi:hypothetical protein